MSEKIQRDGSFPTGGQRERWRKEKSARRLKEREDKRRERDEPKPKEEPKPEARA